MWKINNCGCNTPKIIPIEYSIPENYNINYYQIPEVKTYTSNIEELKDKIICEYLGIINNLECGIQPDLEFLLEEISLVEINDNGTYTIL